MPPPAFADMWNMPANGKIRRSSFYPAIAVVAAAVFFAIPASLAWSDNGWFSANIFGKSKNPSEEMRDILSAPAKLSFGNMELDGKALAAFYAARGYAPAWDTRTDEARSDLAKFLDQIAAFARYHGLDDQEYRIKVPALERSASINGKHPDFTEEDFLADMAVTDMLLRLAHDLRGDYDDFQERYDGWKFLNRHHAKDIPLSLADAVGRGKTTDFLNEMLPSNPAYSALLKALSEYREIESKGGWRGVDPGPTLRPGDASRRIEQVRIRLAAENYLPSLGKDGKHSSLYDDELLDAVAAYQSRNGLHPDGSIGQKTLMSMNVPAAGRVDQIIANMKRWRAMQPEFPDRRVEVNIASAMVEVFEGGVSIYRGPVVIGKPDRKTPFIASALRSVIFNPSWHVPAKIARKDILPKLRKDPHYLEKMGFTIKGSADDPYGAAINWKLISENEFNFRLRQSPGDINSLGRLKFDFDNDFAVYMHGTPHPELFEKDERAQSSGCIRLRDPEEFAVILLSRNSGEWNQEKVRAEIDSNKTRWLRMAAPLPLYVMYWTAFADADGKINFRRDIYGYDVEN